ncbi:MAG TPA: methyltransferase domain-containing protein [Candidatus Kapabacteria bacterium]|nr:methyltransferase domain-containing protein [Candidatus Kapabacteria bacterium]
MLQDRKTIFNALAEEYDAYRPHYPPQALLLLVTLGELNSSSAIADIGTGTGRIAIELAKYVRVVYAVDTAAAMLERLSDNAREEGLMNIRTLETPAEDTGLASESLDMAIMSQSFHWVDEQPALAEMHRVLRPSAPLVVMWNQVTNVSDPYYKNITSLIKQYNPNYRGGADIVSTGFLPAIEASGLFNSVERYSFPFELQYRPESYLGFLLSKSYVGVGIAQDKIPPFIQQVHGYLKESFPHDRITEKYETVMLVARKK